MLTLYRDLLSLRRRYPALSLGSFSLVEAEGSILAYQRESEGQRMIVALNLGGFPHRFRLPPGVRVQPLLSTYVEPIGRGDGAIFLKPNEGVILLVE